MILAALAACSGLAPLGGTDKDPGPDGAITTLDSGDADTDTDSDTDTDTDSDTDIDPSTPTTGVLAVADLQPGDLVITEILRDPVDRSDDVGEWFELLDASGSPVDLVGLVVRDDDLDTFTVATSVVVRDGERVVLGNDPSAAAGAVAYVYGAAMALANGDDELVVGTATVEVDRVAWDAGALWPSASGASTSLDPASTDATANDGPAAWCDAISVYDTTDRGTPGAPNDPC